MTYLLYFLVIYEDLFCSEEVDYVNNYLEQDVGIGPKGIPFTSYQTQELELTNMSIEQCQLELQFHDSLIP